MLNPFGFVLLKYFPPYLRSTDWSFYYITKIYSIYYSRTFLVHLFIKYSDC